MNPMTRAYVNQTFLALKQAANEMSKLARVYRVPAGCLGPHKWEDNVSPESQALWETHFPPSSSAVETALTLLQGNGLRARVLGWKIARLAKKIYKGDSWKLDRGVRRPWRLEKNHHF